MMPVLCGCQQQRSEAAKADQSKSGLSFEFRDKALKAIQDLDDVDVLPTGHNYEVSRSLARQSLMAVERLALESPTPRLIEYKVANYLLAMFNLIETARIQQSYTTSKSVAEYKQFHDDIDVPRSKALATLGFKATTAHPQTLPGYTESEP